MFCVKIKTRGDFMKLAVKSCAKINLTLEITGKREDGYHLINSVFQSVSLCDSLTVEAQTAKNNEITCKTDYLINDNICEKAARLFLQKTNITGVVQITLNKHIPVAAGLGGGSSNAAAVLLSLNKIFDFPLNNNELLELAEKLGADVPFFLNGGTQHVYSIGEKTETVENNTSYALVLIKNSTKPSTAEMYKKLDSIGVTTNNNNTENLIKAIKENNYNLFCQHISNDFENVLNETEIKQDLINGGANTACLSGSGPTVFGVFENKEKAMVAYNNLKEKYQNVYLAEPTSSAILFE